MPMQVGVDRGFVLQLIAAGDHSSISQVQWPKDKLNLEG